MNFPPHQRKRANRYHKNSNIFFCYYCAFQKRFKLKRVLWFLRIFFFLQPDLLKSKFSLRVNFFANLNSIKLQLFCIMYEKIKREGKKNEKWTSNRYLQSKSRIEYQMQRKKSLWWKKYEFINSFWLSAFLSQYS